MRKKKSEEQPELAIEAPAPKRRTTPPKAKPAKEEQPEATAKPRASRPKKPVQSVVAATPQPPAKSRSGRRPTTLAEQVVESGVELEAIEQEVANEPPAPKKPSSRRAQKSKSKADVAPLQLTDEDGITILMWRPKQTGERSPQPQTEPSGLAPRKSRNKRRKEHQDLEITAAAALEKKPVKEERRPIKERSREPKPPVKERVVFERPKPAVKPPKPLIPVPADAPQVVIREGLPTLVRNKVVYPPIAFFGSAPDEVRAKNVLEQIRLAGEAGVHLHSILIDFEVDRQSVSQSASFAAYMLVQALKADPEAQVIFRLVFVAPPGWAEQFPRGRYIASDGTLAEPSVSDDAFWAEAKVCLRDFVRQLRLLETRDHILGIHLERGEWFFAEDWGYDTSDAAKEKFRDWARMRYGNDQVALRAAWFDGEASFENLEIPPYQPGRDDKFVRSSRKERRWVDYHLFLSDATVERIGDLAYCTKEASDGYFLVGASYGYTFEWSHPASGHLSLGKLLRTPEVDFIAGPPSYRSREPGGAAPFPCPVDSFALNGKLYISEEDFKTSIGDRNEPDDFNPVIKTPQSLETVHWRGIGSALAHGAGVCWMDLWGNGWLKTQGTWDRAQKARQTLIHRMAASNNDPDVAVFIDERALAYLVNQKAFALLVQNVRESVLRSGLSAGFYLLSDLQHRERFPEAKLYIFLNAWDIRPELRGAIKNRLQRDNKTLFWLYSAGLFDSGRESLERAREVTGIALKPQPFSSKTGTTILNRRHPLSESFQETGLLGGGSLEPSYFAIPEDATVLGEYSQTGLPSFVVRDFPAGDKSWRSVFLGEPIVTPALVRALGQLAGAHVWNYQEDVVHVRAPFLTIHCKGAGQRTITLPNKWVAYNLISEQWVTAETNSLRFTAIDGSTHCFLVGTHEVIEGILQSDPSTLLEIETLPTRSEDTIRFDASQFDVPIMRLDEWMEGSDDEDYSDDFLFKPRLIDESETSTEEPTQEVGRRRRKRRNDRSQGGSEEGAATHREHAVFEDLSMNVMFRKRE